MKHVIVLIMLMLLASCNETPVDTPRAVKGIEAPRGMIAPNPMVDPPVVTPYIPFKGIETDPDVMSLSASVIDLNTRFCNTMNSSVPLRLNSFIMALKGHTLDKSQSPLTDKVRQQLWASCFDLSWESYIGITNNIFSKLSTIKSKYDYEFTHLASINQNCNSCNVDSLIARMQSRAAAGLPLFPPSSLGKTTACNWANYALTLTACTMLGPIGYWPCAFAVTCENCWGGDIDRTCYWYRKLTSYLNNH
jgi:hypothetical protein